MKFIQILLITIAAAQLGYPQNIDTNKLDEYFNTLDSHDQFMGSIAILKEGEIIYNKQTGFCDIDTDQKPNENSKYQIGSISKTFTAVLVFKAIEEGKLSLSQTIDTFFPTIENAGKITISHLLSHRSGIHNYTDNKKEYLSYHTDPKTEKEMVEIIAGGGSDFEPDSKAAYSNSNYVLLSYILEKIYEKPFAKILEDEITSPLKLKNTHFGGKIKVENNECYAYSLDRNWNKMDETDSSIDMGAGGIVSTPTDLVRFAEALFTNKIISAENVEMMKTIQDKFGMGLFEIQYYDKVSFGHNGEIDGFISVFRYFPDENYAFAITSNGGNYSMNSVAVTIVNSLFNKHYDIPEFRTYEPKSKELKQYLGQYSSETFPVQLTVTKSGKQLFIQATGDSKMSLQATAKGEFKYEPAGISIEFMTEKQQMKITQGGKTNILNKE
ncbi:serine hydrolase domain-containing protein [Marivirga tractuosa]|uniref:serine hydrolase domain-containing protein n=1 Tax=Marivirga tractuosa TaxID=1006 RepID=UPI0035D07DB5